MAWSFLRSIGGGNGTTGFTTSGLDTTTATLLVVALGGAYDFDTGTLADSETNTWTQLTLRTASGGSSLRVRLFYVLSPATNASHTITVTVGGGNPSGVFAAFTGSGTYEAENGVNGNANDTTRNVGSLTPAANGALLIAGVSFNNSSPSVAIDSSYTIATLQNFSAGNYFGTALAYLVQGTAGAVNPQWSNSTDFGPGVHASFATSASGPTFVPRIILI